MKTIKLFSKASCLFFILSITACSKNDAVKKSSTELLTQKVWNYEGYGLDENNNGIIDPSEQDMIDCQSDDVFTFNADGTGTLESGTIKCDANEPDIQAFTWQISNNETELVINSFVEQISKLDDSVLEVYFDDQNSLGQTVKYITRYKH